MQNDVTPHALARETHQWPKKFRSTFSTLSTRRRHSVCYRSVIETDLVQVSSLISA
jgi:hypothetical protein